MISIFPLSQKHEPNAHKHAKGLLLLCQLLQPRYEIIHQMFITRFNIFIPWNEKSYDYFNVPFAFSHIKKRSSNYRGNVKTSEEMLQLLFFSHKKSNVDTN